MWLKNILETIGNTPMIELNKSVKGLPCKVLAKVEYFNPGNSVKDRMAVKMVEAAEREGLLKPGGTIIEGTSGNTGMGLALAAIIKGYKCIFTTTDKQSKEKVDILKALGAEVIVCPTNVEPEDPQSYYSVSRRLAEQTPNSFYVNQYDNLANRQAHYEETGPEIWEQTEGKITHLVVASGTGGTVTGTGKYLKEKNKDIQVWAIDSYGSLLTKYYRTGELDTREVYPYITEGIGEDFVPQNFDMSYIDHFEQVTDKDAAVMARRITKEEGIFVGYSAGSALQGIFQLKDQMTTFLYRGFNRHDRIGLFHHLAHPFIFQFGIGKYLLKKPALADGTDKQILIFHRDILNIELLHKFYRLHDGGVRFNSNQFIFSAATNDIL